jgi:hypothetical protein
VATNDVHTPQIICLVALAVITRDKQEADMNKKFRELSKQARIQMASDARLQEFGELIVQECINAVEQTDRTHAYTTFDLSLIDATIARSKKSIINHFNKDQDEGTVD